MGKNGKKRCFVVQGFGLKTDFRTGRQLNLDDSFEIIQEAIEDAGLECIRADKVMHSGSIDVEMWEEVLNADLVVADVSTSNWNAAYELGVRHALRPRSTIVVAEEQFEFAFDINHIAIHTYAHGGKELGRHEAKRFRKHLQTLIEKVMSEADGRPDSPVFLSLPHLNAPIRGESPQTPAASVSDEMAETSVGAASSAAPTEAWGTLRDQAMQAKGADDWKAARKYLEAAHKIVPKEEYITQQLSLATRKAVKLKGDSEEEKAAYRAALEESIAILARLGPETSADPETLGLWSASHKELWYLDRTRKHLDEAIRASEKGFLLKDDYYNGINLAFLLNVRAAEPEQHEGEAIADFVHARQVRRRVEFICTRQVADWSEDKEDALDPGELSQQEEERYWVLTTLQEAAAGMEDAEGEKQWKAAAAKLNPEDWMVESSEKQLGRLRKLLEPSPLDRLDVGASDGGPALARAQAEASAAKSEAAEAQGALADTKAKLAAAEGRVNRAEEARTAVEARAIEAECGETAVESKVTPAAVVAADPGESRSVQFSLIAGAVELQVSGTDVEVTVRSPVV